MGGGWKDRRRWGEGTPAIDELKSQLAEKQKGWRSAGKAADRMEASQMSDQGMNAGSVVNHCENDCLTPTAFCNSSIIINNEIVWISVCYAARTRFSHVAH